jgi:DNA relaxase NicK
LIPATQRSGVWKHWKCDKYTGWTLGQYSIGWSGPDYMVEVRSEPAHEFWLNYHGLFSRCTRLDVAYDIAIRDTGFCLADMMKEYFHRSKKYRKGTNNDPIDYEHRVGVGKTWGLGKRSSSAYFRCYNKTAEQGWPMNKQVGIIWRLELEMKRGRAQYYHDQSKKVDGPYLAAKTALYSYLKHFMFAPDALSWDCVRTLPYKRKNESNVEKTLAWMKSKVRPSIDRLVEAGYAADVLDNLDLLELMQEGGPIYG